MPPAIVFEADKAHEQVHIDKCKSKGPGAYGEYLQDKKNYAIDENEAYNAKIKVLESWLRQELQELEVSYHRALYFLDKAAIWGRSTWGITWNAIRKLVNDAEGSTVYWYIELWNVIKRYQKTGNMQFTLLQQPEEDGHKNIKGPRIIPGPFPLYQSKDAYFCW